MAGQITLVGKVIVPQIIKIKQGLFTTDPESRQAA